MKKNFCIYLLICIGTLIVSACDGRAQNETVGQQVGIAVDRTVAGTKDALDRVKEQAAIAGDSVHRSVEENGPGIEAGARNAGAALKQTFDDATLTARVVNKLHADANLSSSKIDVKSATGTVTLKGNVPTPESKQLAAAVASSVDGVMSVDNQLTVGGG